MLKMNQKHPPSAPSDDVQVSENSHTASVHVLPQARKDEEIIERLRLREKSAAAMLYDRYAPEVNRLIWQLLGADPDHDDLVQQVFCQLLTSAHKVREPGKLRGFVLRVTINMVRSELRKRSVRRRFLRAEDDPDRFESIHSDHETRAILRHTFEILERMPTNERIVFTLRHVDGRSLDEVSHLCSCSLSTTKRKLNKAQKRFHTFAKNDPLLASYLGELSQGGLS